MILVMMMKHNKKRNTGLLYEFLVGNITTALVENDQRRSAVSLKVLKKHFKNDSTLYKEFRLINSLIKTTVSSEAIAASIIHEAKNAARSIDESQLDREKSLLIRSINHKLNDDTFFDRQVSEYKMYATIQTLLNEWRSKNPDLGTIASFEDQLLTWLTTPRNKEKPEVINEDPVQSRLLMKVMTKKLNEKYFSVLSESQRQLVKTYAWSSSKDDPELIKQKLKEIKTNIISSIDSYVVSTPDNQYVNDKLTNVKEQVLSESLDIVNDDLVVRFMLYVNLHNELTGEDT